MPKKKKASGQRPLGRRQMILLVILLYCIGLLLGSAIILTIPAMSYRSEMLDTARERTESTLHYYSSKPELGYGTEYYMYNSQGFLITSDVSFLTEESSAGVLNYLQEALAADSTYRVIRLSLRTGNSTVHCFGLLASASMEAYGNRFVGFVVRELSTLNVSTETFAVLYTIIYIAAVLLILYVVREQRELDVMRRDLIANVGHELKTPITSIRAMAEIIHDGMEKDTVTRKRYCSSIMDEADNLEALVTDILELSRLQSKKARFSKVRFHLDGLCNPVIDRYAMMCADTGITLESPGMDDLESLPVVFTDPKYITMLMNILFDNAIKFTGAGGTITISKQIRPHSVTFCIRDTGPGIAPEDIGHIFDRFYKADTAHNAKGSGLGLAIADEIAKGLGEKLWVESELGHGSAFYFTVQFA